MITPRRWTSMSPVAGQYGIGGPRGSTPVSPLAAVPRPDWGKTAGQQGQTRSLKEIERVAPGRPGGDARGPTPVTPGNARMPISIHGFRRPRQSRMMIEG
jgi:hypothetical protein